jgi:hypothetical protein
MEMDTHSRALLYVSFRVSSKGALPPSFPCRAPVERDAPSPEPSFICLSESPVIMPSISSHLSEELAVSMRFNDVQIVCFLSVPLIYTC